jgi:cytochrome c
MISKMVRSFLAALVGMFATPTLAQDSGALERRGNTLLTRNCSRCHAIGTIGNSPHVQAPAF